MGFVKVSEEFLQRGKKSKVHFFFAISEEVLEYWNNGIAVSCLEARETNKALVIPPPLVEI